jgi:hypothetical protein
MAVKMTMLFSPEDGDNMFLQNAGIYLRSLHRVTIQKNIVSGHDIKNYGPAR